MPRGGDLGHEYDLDSVGSILYTNVLVYYTRNGNALFFSFFEDKWRCTFGKTLINESFKKYISE